MNKMASVRRLERYAPHLGGECETAARARWLKLSYVEFGMNTISSFLVSRAMLESGLVRWRAVSGRCKCKTYATGGPPCRAMFYGYVPIMALCVAKVWIERRGGSDAELEALIIALKEGPEALQKWEAFWALGK